jgi:hypothetical protein
MSIPNAPKPPPNNHSVKWVAVPAVVAIAFVLGRGTLDPPSRAPTAGAPMEAGRSSARAARSEVRELPSEVEARVHHEVRAAIERLRPQVVARCWPSDGLPGGRRETTVTYDVTFDPAGREVARGVLAEGEAPAAFGECLRRLETTSLSVSPTGNYVSLRFPVTYP